MMSKTFKPEFYWLVFASNKRVSEFATHWHAKIVTILINLIFGTLIFPSEINTMRLLIFFDSVNFRRSYSIK